MISLRKLLLAGFLVLIAITSIVLVLMPASVVVTKATTKYTYYGKVPNNLWRYDWDSTLREWVIGVQPFDSMLLAMTAYEDSTTINVYDLKTGELLSQAILNAMERHYVVIRNGTIFKVESNKPLCTLLLNYQSVPAANVTSGPVPHTYYPATDGSFVGKEFILLASTDINPQFVIYALEKSEVTITGDGGDKRTITVDANNYARVVLNSWRTYKIESTGYIMIQSGNPHTYYDPHYSYAIPSANGAFLGRYFYTYSNSYWDPEEDYGFMILSLERTKVTVYNLVERTVLKEFTVEPERSYRFQVEVREDPRTQAIFIESEKPVWLTFLHEGDVYKHVGRLVSYGSGIFYTGVRPNEDTLIYLPKNSTCEVYIFVSETATIDIDGFVTTLQPDKPFFLTQPGLHEIRSDKNAIVLTIHWPMKPEGQGLEYPGTIIPCVETVNISHDVNVEPPSPSSPTTTYIIAAVAVAAVAFAVFILRRRRR